MSRLRAAFSDDATGVAESSWQPPFRRHFSDFRQMEDITRLVTQQLLIYAQRLE